MPHGTCVDHWSKVDTHFRLILNHLRVAQGQVTSQELFAIGTQLMCISHIALARLPRGPRECKRHGLPGVKLAGVFHAVISPRISHCSIWTSLARSGHLALVEYDFEPFTQRIVVNRNLRVTIVKLVCGAYQREARRRACGSREKNFQDV